MRSTAAAPAHVSAVPIPSAREWPPASALNVDRTEKILIQKMDASRFMRGEMIIEKLGKYFPEGDDVFEEIS